MRQVNFSAAEENESPLPTKSVTQTITKFGGLVKCGDIHCCVQLKGNSIVPDQKARVKISFLNNSNTTVKAFSMSLKQKSHYYGPKEDPSSQTTPHPRESSKTLWSTQSVPLDATLSQRSSTATSITANSDDADTDSEHDEFVHHVLSLPSLPDKALNTFSSQNHYVRHVLKVTLVTENAHSNLVVKLPVTVGPAVSTTTKGGNRRSMVGRASVRPSTVKDAAVISLRDVSCV